MTSGWFITVEGGEGSGKTTLAARIVQLLEAAGYRAIATREPGGIDIAEEIRSLILDKRHTTMDGRTEALLYAAARRQHLVEKVIPALEQGCTVVCDRFVDSSLAYQGYARGIGVEEVWSINRFATNGMLPDLTLLLDAEPETGLGRIRENRHWEMNRLDLESIDFHRKVREGYLRIAEMFSDRIVVVNAERPEERVFADVAAILRDRLGVSAVPLSKFDEKRQ